MTHCADALREAIGEGAAAVTVMDIGQRVLPALGRAIGACPSFLAEVAPIFVESQAVGGEHREMFSQYLRDFVHDDPTIRVSMNHPRPVLVLAEHVERRVLHASRAYNEFHRRFDMEHQLLVRFSGSRLTSPGALAIGFTRGARQTPFGRDEVAIAELVLPALEGAARRIRGALSGRQIDRLRDEYRLTSAEERVLRVLAVGASNREIAQSLFVSVETVKTHVQHMLRKTGTSSRGKLLALARTRE